MELSIYGRYGTNVSPQVEGIFRISRVLACAGGLALEQYSRSGTTATIGEAHLEIHSRDGLRASTDNRA